MSVSDAETMMMSYTDHKIKKVGEKMLKESQNSITGIADAFANDGTTSSAVGKMGGKMEKSLQPHLDGMVTSSAKAYADIKSNIDKAQNYADNHPITYTETTKKKTVVEGDDNKKYFPQSLFNSGRPVVDTDIMPMSEDAIATYSDISPYASVANATTAIMSGSTSRSVGSVGNINLSAITNRLDRMINAIGNCDLTINLQPMQLDGNVVTDTVQEIVSIRDMLKNIGKGVA